MDETPRFKSDLKRRYQEEISRSPEDPQSDQGVGELSAPRKDWQSLVEEQIAKLDLNNLRNKGKPLNLNENPYLDPADAATHRLLRDAGFTLPWIDDSRKIDADLEKARRRLEQAHAEYLERRDAQICAGHQWVEGSWEAAQRDFHQEVERINQQIRDYNLKSPSAALHKFSVRVDEELARLGVSQS